MDPKDKYDMDQAPRGRVVFFTRLNVASLSLQSPHALRSPRRRCPSGKPRLAQKVRTRLSRHLRAAQIRPPVKNKSPLVHIMPVIATRGGRGGKGKLLGVIPYTTLTHAKACEMSRPPLRCWSNVTCESMSTSELRKPAASQPVAKESRKSTAVKFASGWGPIRGAFRRRIEMPAAVAILPQSVHLQ